MLDKCIKYDTIMEGRAGIIKVDGFKFVTHKGDHPPRHVHIFYRGRQLGRFDIENRRSMDRKLVLDGRLKKAIKKAGYL